MYSAYKLNKQGDSIQPWSTHFPIWKQFIVPCPVLTVASWTCIQISQEAGEGVWYSYLLKNFPQFVVIHTVKGFSLVNEAEVDDFLEFSCFCYDPVHVGNLTSGSSALWACGNPQLIQLIRSLGEYLGLGTGIWSHKANMGFALSLWVCTDFSWLMS